MKIFRKIFGLKSSSSSVKTARNEVAINESSWYLNHTESVLSEFKFLITDLRFETLKNNEFVGHEIWTIYVKDSIKVEIWSDIGDLPFVFIRNTELPYDESKELDNRDFIDDYNQKAKKIRQEWTKRRKPIQQRFMTQWSSGNLDLSELNKDYETLGKEEHAAYLRLAATTVKHNIKNKVGKLINVP